VKGTANLVGSLLREIADLIAPRRDKGSADIATGPSQTIVSTDPEEVAREYASTLLTEARDELTRADQKASILLAAAGVAVGAIVAGMVSSGWTPSRLTYPWSYVWAIGAVIGLLGILCLIVAIYPRTTRGKDDEAQLFYFGHAAKVATVDDLARELRRSSTNTFQRSADQLWRVSQVVTAKYSLVRVAIWLLSIGSLTALASSVLSSF
jgi:MFS family permease